MMRAVAVFLVVANDARQASLKHTYKTLLRLGGIGDKGILVCTSSSKQPDREHS